MTKDAADVQTGVDANSFIRSRIERNERLLSYFAKDLREAQSAQPMPDYARETSDRVIIARLEQRIATLKSRCKKHRHLPLTNPHP